MPTFAINQLPVRTFGNCWSGIFMPSCRSAPGDWVHTEMVYLPTGGHPSKY